jgi:hypothetical protein
LSDSESVSHPKTTHYPLSPDEASHPTNPLNTRGIPDARTSPQNKTSATTQRCETPGKKSIRYVSGMYPVHRVNTNCNRRLWTLCPQRSLKAPRPQASGRSVLESVSVYVGVQPRIILQLQVAEWSKEIAFYGKTGSMHAHDMLSMCNLPRREAPHISSLETTIIICPAQYREEPQRRTENGFLKAASCVSLKKSPRARIHSNYRRSWLHTAHTL